MYRESQERRASELQEREGDFLCAPPTCPEKQCVHVLPSVPCAAATLPRACGCLDLKGTLSRPTWGRGEANAVTAGAFQTQVGQPVRSPARPIGCAGERGGGRHSSSGLPDSPPPRQPPRLSGQHGQTASLQRNSHTKLPSISTQVLRQLDSIWMFACLLAAELRSRAGGCVPSYGTPSSYSVAQLRAVRAFGFMSSGCGCVVCVPLTHHVSCTGTGVW